MLVNEAQKPGGYQAHFKATSLAADFYFYRLEVRSLGPAGGGTGSYSQIMKLILLR